MKKLSILIALMITSLLTAQTNWNFDKAHSSIRFSVPHMVISEVDGQFTNYEGSIETISTEDFSDAKINFEIDMNSVNTDNAKRDGHLKSADFFETEKFPTMTFVSTSVKKTGDKTYDLTGNLTLHGFTKEITLNLSHGGTIIDPYGNTRAGIKVGGIINRTDFGLKYNSVMETGGLLIGENVNVTCKVELVKK